MINAYALSGRFYNTHIIPRVLPWAGCLLGFQPAIRNLTIIAIMLTIHLPVAAATDGDSLVLTLSDAVNIARRNSVDAAVALNELKAAYWEYRSFKADLLPEITFEGTLPTYSKQNTAYQTDDGRYTFVSSNYLEATGAINATQKIWATGGTLTLSTSLDYLKQYGSGGEHRFMSIPVGLTLSQTLFGVNDVKWKRRIDPVRYREAKANFLTASEQVTMKAITCYFSLLMAKENLAIARQNYANAQKLYDVAVAKRKMGRISENDLRQIRQSMLQAQSTLIDNETQLNNSRFQLTTFLNLPDGTDIVTSVPDALLPSHIDYRTALDKAMENYAINHNIRRRKLEADYNVASARGRLRSIEVYASVGYTGQDKRFGNAYSPLKDYQQVEIGMKIPLLDWGKRRGDVRVAESNRDMVRSQLRQEQQTFNQNLFILVEQLNNQAQQLNIAEQKDSIAQKRYETSIATFMAGSISTLELNDAQQSKDEARQNRISRLYDYWYDFYRLRSLTLWDFINNSDINADFEQLVK